MICRCSVKMRALLPRSLMQKASRTLVVLIEAKNLLLIRQVGLLVVVGLARITAESRSTRRTFEGLSMLAS
jgi:hypothetical protein